MMVNGVSFLLGGSSPFCLASWTKRRSASRPYLKYCQTIHTDPNSAETGHTTFMIHMCCGCRSRSSATIRKQKPESERDAIERTSRIEVASLISAERVRGAGVPNGESSRRSPEARTVKAPGLMRRRLDRVASPEFIALDTSYPERWGEASIACLPCDLLAADFALPQIGKSLPQQVQDDPDLGKIHHALVADDRLRCAQRGRKRELQLHKLA